jgi:hypothetical protein
MVSLLKSGFTKLTKEKEKFKISISFDTLEAKVF